MTRKSRPPVHLLLVLCLVVFMITPADVAAINFPSYGGWQTTSSWAGVDGYIRQSTTSSLSTDQYHADWINVCGTDCSVKWVQMGEFQGYTAHGNAPTSLLVFHENKDACQMYYPGNSGAPPAADYPYYLHYNGSGAHSIYCGAGIYATAYTYEYHMGGLSAPQLIYAGNIDASSGLVLVKTEVNGNTLPPMNNDYYGCDPALACNDSSKGIHLYNGSSWLLWQSGATASRYNPPWLTTYSSYWAFRTCADQLHCPTP